jgi:hypothetical protein
MLWLPRSWSLAKVEDKLTRMTDGRIVVVAAEVFDHPEAKPAKGNGEAGAGEITGPWLLGPEDEVLAELARLGFESFSIQASAGYDPGREDAPLYRHDCDNCTFLGRFDDNERLVIFDLYYCPQSTLATVVARFGDESHEYLSGPFETPELLEARLRAKARGLLG